MKFWNMNKVKSRVIPKISAIVIVSLISSATILYIPQQTYAISAGGVVNAFKIGIELVGSLIALYDSVKSHMTPAEATVTGNGIEQIESESYDEAANSFDQALQINRENLVALNGKGIIALRSAIYSPTPYNPADFYEPMSFFDQALQIDPNNVAALLGKGISVAGTGNHKAAVIFFEGVLQIDPNNFDALMCKGMALTRSGNPNEAIMALDQALQIVPNDEFLLNGLLNEKGLALLASGRHNEAIIPFNQVLQRDPNNVDALFGLGMTTRNPVKALNFFNQALQIDPNNIDALVGSGQIHYYEGNLMEALNFFNQALQRNPHHPLALQYKNLILQN